MFFKMVSSEDKNISDFLKYFYSNQDPFWKLPLQELMRKEMRI